jgi:hypothetical protein
MPCCPGGADVHGEVVYGRPVEVLIEESGHADVLVPDRYRRMRDWPQAGQQLARSTSRWEGGRRGR